MIVVSCASLRVLYTRRALLNCLYSRFDSRARNNKNKKKKKPTTHRVKNTLSHTHPSSPSVSPPATVFVRRCFLTNAIHTGEKRRRNFHFASVAPRESRGRIRHANKATRCGTGGTPKPLCAYRAILFTVIRPVSRRTVGESRDSRRRVKHDSESDRRLVHAVRTPRFSSADEAPSSW